MLATFDGFLAPSPSHVAEEKHQPTHHEHKFSPWRGSYPWSRAGVNRFLTEPGRLMFLQGIPKELQCRPRRLSQRFERP